MACGREIKEGGGYDVLSILPSHTVSGADLSVRAKDTPLKVLYAIYSRMALFLSSSGKWRILNHD